MSGVVLFLSGPPKAGKSRLRGDIYRTLVVEGKTSWFVQAFSPDCEGQWVNDAHENGRGGLAEELARRQKNAIKRAGEFFSPRFVALMQQQLEGLCKTFKFVVADLGGLPSQQNKDICSAAFGMAVPAAVVLVNNRGEDGGWQDFWQEMGVPYLLVRYAPDLAKKIIKKFYFNT